MTNKQRYLDALDREHAITMRVLRAYPGDKLDLRPHEKLKSARELGWVFVLERYLAQRVWRDELAKGIAGHPPKAPDDWNEVLRGVEQAQRELRDLVSNATEAELEQKVHFLTGPKTMGETRRIDFLDFLLADEIHHRGQFSIYLRMSGAKVPSIYGPTADEPWWP